ncbi:MAG TPA: hypothetical protein VJ302_37730 [Blastocatellia bacterium]|nr:hypothetical protein [Blastocatellia bacterium]
MKRLSLLLGLIAIVVSLSGRGTDAAGWTSSMSEGKPELKSMGPLAFGPEGILFVADPKSAAIVAIATGDVKAGDSAKLLQIEGLNQKIAALLGTSPEEILIEDLAINPISRNGYLAVSRGRGPEAVPVLVRAKTDGQLEVVALDKVKFSRAQLPDAPADAMVGQGNRQSNPRRESITDLAFLNGKVFVAGLANEEFASTLRSLPFPFQTVDHGTSVEIYHGAHGRFETRAPIRTFVPFKVGKEDRLLAAYTCTPLVEFSLSELKPGAKIQGKTIAELGNRNRPLDMVVYQKDGKTYLLLANNNRGVMKISTDNIETVESITAPVSGGGKKGLAYETIESWKNVDQLEQLDSKHVVLLRRAENGSLNLESMPVP